jgi:hypothetical protein
MITPITIAHHHPVILPEVSGKIPNNTRSKIPPENVIPTLAPAISIAQNDSPAIGTWNR